MGFNREANTLPKCRAHYLKHLVEQIAEEFRLLQCFCYCLLVRFRWVFLAGKLAAADYPYLGIFSEILADYFNPKRH